MKAYDVVVVGAGPGGYVAAVHAAHLGLKTAIVEKDKDLGGTCLLRGCIPTKSLLHSADLLESMRRAKSYGVIAKEISCDFAGVQKAREKVVQKSAAGVAYLMKENNVEVHNGFGRLLDANTVEVEDASGRRESVRAKHIILATGSVPRRVPFVDIDGEQVVTSDELLRIKAPPRSMIILGAGAVGVEFASVFQRFGSKCTVVEMVEHVLPNEDEEVSREFAKAFKKRGIACHTGTRLESVSLSNGNVEATLRSATESWKETAELLLVAVGRAPVTDGVGLETVGIKTERGFVVVDGAMRTSVPNIYAIGDIVATPQLAHTASAEAQVAVEHLLGKEPQPINYRHNPGATYADPEVASVGLSERKAREAGYTINVGKFPFSALGKARILGKTEGFVKIVADAAYDEILGVHIIGPHATDLIAEACVAMRLEATSEELARTIHAHPTLSEAVMEAAHGVLHRPIHL